MSPEGVGVKRPEDDPATVGRHEHVAIFRPPVAEPWRGRRRDASDRNNAQAQRLLVVMQAASVKQRLDTVLQRARIRRLKDAQRTR